MAGDWRLKILFVSFWFHFGNILGAVGRILGTTRFTMGAYLVPCSYIGSAGVILGACRFHFGRAWEIREPILKSLGVTLDASGRDAAPPTPPLPFPSPPSHLQCLFARHPRLSKRHMQTLGGMQNKNMLSLCAISECARLGSGS